MAPANATGCTVRIKPAVGQVVLAEFQADVDPDDTISCLALLRRTVKVQSWTLGRGKDVAGYRIEAYDAKRWTWITHVP